MIADPPSTPPASPPRDLLRTYLRAGLWLLFGAYVAVVAWSYYGGYARAARGEPPAHTDFTHTYGASLLVQQAPAEYLFYPREMTLAMQLAMRAQYGDDLPLRQAIWAGFAPWLYPPTFVLVIAPLAYLPYLLALFSWLAITAVPYLAAMREILRSRGAIPLALAAPPVYYNIAYGQSGFLTAGLIGLGFAQLERRPTLAGICFGLASVKPHFGVLIPLALVAGGRWQAFSVASITTVGLMVLSVLLLGADPWYLFISVMEHHQLGFQEETYDWRLMTSILSTAHLAGMSLDSAWVVQYAASAAAALVVGYVWWHGSCRPNTLGLQAAVLCLATPLAVPMVYLYDLVLLTPAVAWIWCDMQARGRRPWENGALLAALGALFTVYPLARATGLQLGAVPVAILLALAMYRYAGAATVRAEQPALSVALIGGRN